MDNPAQEVAPPRHVRSASPLRRLYRLWNPIPRSPSPATPAEAHCLQLIPPADLTERFCWAAAFLEKELQSCLGAYVEFGVYNGSSMLCMLEALARINNPTMPLYGFDSFAGLPPTAAEEDGGVWQAGQFSCPRPVTEARLAGADHAPNKVTLLEGWYSDTLTRGDVYGIGSASIVMVDSDTYSSARLALSFVAPLLTSPSVLIFDDWKLNDLDVKCMGEYRAFHEWAAQYSTITWKSVRSYNRKSKMFVLRRR